MRHRRETELGVIKYTQDREEAKLLWPTFTWRKWEGRLLALLKGVYPATGTGMWTTPGSKSKPKKWNPSLLFLTFTREDTKDDCLPFQDCAAHIEGNGKRKFTESPHTHRPEHPI